MEKNYGQKQHQLIVFSISHEMKWGKNIWLFNIVSRSKMLLKHKFQFVLCESLSRIIIFHVHNICTHTRKEVYVKPSHLQ